MYDVVEPCSDSGAYRAEPKRKTKIDLEELEKHLSKEKFKIEFSSEVILLVLHPEFDVEIGIYPSGKLLFKTTKKDIVDELYEEFTELIKKFKEI